MTKVLSCHGPVSNDMTMIAQSLFRALEEGVSAVQINSCDLYRAIRGNVVRVEVPPRVSAVTRPPEPVLFCVYRGKLGDGVTAKSDYRTENRRQSHQRLEDTFQTLVLYAACQL